MLIECAPMCIKNDTVNFLLPVVHSWQQNIIIPLSPFILWIAAHLSSILCLTHLPLLPQWSLWHCWWYQFWGTQSSSLRRCKTRIKPSVNCKFKSLVSLSTSIYMLTKKIVFLTLDMYLCCTILKCLSDCLYNTTKCFLNYIYMLEESTVVIWVERERFDNLSNKLYGSHSFSFLELAKLVWPLSGTNLGVLFKRAQFIHYSVSALVKLFFYMWSCNIKFKLEH